MSIGRMLLAGRLARLAVIAAVLLGAAAWWKFSGDPGAVVSRRDAPGTVVEVHEKAYRIRLDAGGTVLVAREGSLEAGAKVVLTATRHANGEESYSLEAADAAR